MPHACCEPPELYAQARRIMGKDGCPCQHPDGTVCNVSWDKPEVLHAFGVTTQADYLTFYALCIALNLPAIGYYRLCVYAPPEGQDAHGHLWVAPNSAYPDCPYQTWQDDAIEETGEYGITSAGVLLLAARYQGGKRRG